MFWADSVGSGNIYVKLNKWADTYGNFFRPSAYLEERAIKGLPLVINLSIFIFHLSSSVLGLIGKNCS